MSVRKTIQLSLCIIMPGFVLNDRKVILTRVFESKSKDKKGHSRERIYLFYINVSEDWCWCWTQLKFAICRVWGLSGCLPRKRSSDSFHLTTYSSMDHPDLSYRTKDVWGHGTVRCMKIEREKSNSMSRDVGALRHVCCLCLLDSFAMKVQHIVQCNCCSAALPVYISPHIFS